MRATVVRPVQFKLFRSVDGGLQISVAVHHHHPEPEGEAMAHRIARTPKPAKKPPSHNPKAEPGDNSLHGPVE